MTITEQALALAAPAWPYPGVATVHALVAALGLDGEPVGQQASAVRQFMQDPAWDAAPPVLQRDVRRWLGLLWMSQAELSVSAQFAAGETISGQEDAGTITAQMANAETISGQVTALAAADATTLSVDVTGPPDQVAGFAQLCKTIQSLCEVGASRTVQVDVDGDGNASLRFAFAPPDAADSVKPASFDSDPVRVPGIGG